MSKVIKLGKQNVTVMPALSVRVGAKGKTRHIGAVYAELPKGEARRLRKALRAAGHTQHAAAPRLPSFILGPVKN